MDDVMVMFKATRAVKMDAVTATRGDETQLELMLPTKVVLADELKAHGGEWVDRVRCSADQCGQGARAVQLPPPHLRFRWKTAPGAYVGALHFFSSKATGDGGRAYCS